MTHMPAAARRLFVEQHGVASVAQLTSAGLSVSQLRWMGRIGELELLLRGVYRSTLVPLTELGRCAAVCLARPATVIAGITAGRLWRLRRLPADRRVHVLAPPASNPAIAPWVVPYRTAAIHPADNVLRCDGIRVTTRARTVFDLTRTLDSDDLLSVIEQVMRDGGVTDHELRCVAADWLTPRRPWAYRFLDQLDRRLDGGAAESHPESRFGDALRNAGVHLLVRQLPVELPGYGAARFDLAVPHLKLAIEIDVFPTHQETLGKHRDAARDRAAAAVGWQVHRIDREAYEHRFEAAVRETVELCRARAAARPTDEPTGAPTPAGSSRRRRITHR